MVRHKFIWIASLFLLASSAFSAVTPSDAQLIEELTGKKTAPPVTAKTLSQRHLMAGLEAMKNKNYIVALKHYNTVIVKYKKSKEVESAYLAKARLYKEMGLPEQAKLNLQQAQEIRKITK